MKPVCYIALEYRLSLCNGSFVANENSVTSFNDGVPGAESLRTGPRAAIQLLVPRCLPPCLACWVLKLPATVTVRLHAVGHLNNVLGAVGQCWTKTSKAALLQWFQQQQHQPRELFAEGNALAGASVGYASVCSFARTGFIWTSLIHCPDCSEF
jgi:hypothetical protein